MSIPLANLYNKGNLERGNAVRGRGRSSAAGGLLLMTFRRIPVIAAAAAAVIGVPLVWLVRAQGGACVDGLNTETNEYFGYCVDWDSATGALPATMAIVALMTAAFVVSRIAPQRVRLAFLLAALIVVPVIAGVAVNLAIVDYPEGYVG